MYNSVLKETRREGKNGLLHWNKGEDTVKLKTETRHGLERASLPSAEAAHIHTVRSRDFRISAWRGPGELVAVNILAIAIRRAELAGGNKFSGSMYDCLFLFQLNNPPVLYWKKKDFCVSYRSNEFMQKLRAHQSTVSLMRYFE